MGERAARRRALGQHLLIDAAVAARTVVAAGVEPGALVLEIGPGRGALTRELLAAGARVVAVEIDPDLAQGLARQEHAGLEVVPGDFLRLGLDALPGEPAQVVANLPYSTGTAILARLVEHPTRFPRATVMLQREVAERLCARPGSRDYGALTVLTALVATARPCFVVPPAAFAPPPKVDSAVLRLDVEAAPRAAVGDPAVFRRVVRAAFAQRRKTLRNALRAAFGEARAAAWLEAASIDGSRRAETLALEEFAALARAAQDPALEAQPACAGDGRAEREPAGGG